LAAAARRINGHGRVRMAILLSMASDPTARYGDLACLLPLTGRWRIDSDTISGETSFAWSPGRKFLVQVFDFKRGGRWLDGIEFIGRTTDESGARSAEITARAYFFRDGRTADSIWRLEDSALTIWRGERGSDKVMSAQFDPDGRRYAGAWRWPGGGYDFEAHRIGEA
jgi:hypothetical protein